MQLSRVYDGRIKARGEPFEVRRLPAGFSIRLIKMEGLAAEISAAGHRSPVSGNKKAGSEKTRLSLLEVPIKAKPPEGNTPRR